jgi:hypothetical protein
MVNSGSSFGVSSLQLEIGLGLSKMIEKRKTMA